MIDISKAGTFKLGDRTVKRWDTARCSSPAPACSGRRRIAKAAIAVLREAVASGVDHIDTSDFYGPHVTNQLIREALHPYPEDLVIVTKVGAGRGDDGSWTPAFSAGGPHAARCTTTCAISGLDALDVVNLRMHVRASTARPRARSRSTLAALAELQRQGLVRHIGLSNVTSAAGRTRRAASRTIVCVQNQYNLAHRDDDAADRRAGGRRASPTCRSSRSAASRRCSRQTLSDVAEELGATPDAGGARLAAAARAQHPADSRHFVARASA